MDMVSPVHFRMEDGLVSLQCVVTTVRRLV